MTIQPAEYLKIIIIWYLANKFSKQQEDIAVYDFQVFNTKSVASSCVLNDWQLCPLGIDWEPCYFPDLGNASILALVALIMYTISGIAYRWFLAFFGILVGISALSLSFISFIGVDKFSKVPVFGYVAKRFSAILTLLPIWQEQATNLQIPTLPW